MLVILNPRWWTYAPLVLFGCSGCASQLPVTHECSEENPHYWALLANCSERVALECPDVPDEQCQAVADCDAEIERRCQ